MMHIFWTNKFVRLSLGAGMVVQKNVLGSTFAERKFVKIEKMRRQPDRQYQVCLSFVDTD